MFVIKLVAVIGIIILSLTEATSTKAATTTPTPALTYVFTAKLNVGRPLDPIPLLQGGSRTIEPLINGTISGPYLNGTVKSGFAAPITAFGTTVTGDTTVQIPEIYLYGVTSDGLPFYIQESGIGPVTGQNTRVVLEVGGKYKALQSMYILAQPTINAARTVVTVDGFSVAPPL
jgi:hypothetical protein